MRVKILTAQTGWPAYKFHQQLVGKVFPATQQVIKEGYVVDISSVIAGKYSLFFMACEVEVINE